jgi:hypothetical protein
MVFKMDGTDLLAEDVHIYQNAKIIVIRIASAFASGSHTLKV